ncbi:hypothetical protein F511_07242 [Dorcoceras hygrometricum]|uniref:Uncharacterized protein n=1 Tax=Dorcoceras hygrometricum TaxID=472368 RepID=A0A2Z7AVI7_9LAMI|nr:hypothetical protein F511_07242 [Dorcoceras hygrometricum]
MKKRRASTPPEKEARGEKRKKKEASTSRSRLEKIPEGGRASTPPTRATEGRPEPRPVITIADASSPPKEKGSRRGPPLDYSEDSLVVSPSGAVATRYICHMAPDRDINMLQGATDSEAVSHFTDQITSKEARREKRKNKDASTSRSRPEKILEGGRAPTPPTHTTEGCPEPPLIITIAEASSPPKEKGSRQSPPLDYSEDSLVVSPSGDVATRYICHMSPDRDINLLRGATDSEAVSHFAAKLTSILTGNTISAGDKAGGRGRVRLISKGIETAPAVRHVPPRTHGPNNPTLTHIIGALCASWEFLVRQAADVVPLDLVSHVGCKIVMPDLNGWIDMPVLVISSVRLDYFLNRFDVPSCSFIITDDVMIPFRSSDFSIVLALHHSGQPVDLDLKMESRFLARHFASKVTKADRAAIRERMMLLAGTSYVTPSFIFPYLDDLTTFLNHAWGDAAFRFLYREICHLESKMYVDGCVVGLMLNTETKNESEKTASNSRGEEELDEFRGRSDFIGHEKSSDEDRKLVMEFLGKDKFEEEGIFKLWNSKHDAFAVGTKKVYIRFLAGCLRHLSRFNLASHDLVRERCKQQGPTLSCGVYSCKWLHCLAYDTPEIWECEQKADVNAYRVRICMPLIK